MCPRQRGIDSWPAAHTRLRHILAIPVPRPWAGARWLLPLADLAMLRHGKHQPSLLLALAPQPLHSDPHGVRLGPPVLPVHGE